MKQKGMRPVRFRWWEMLLCMAVMAAVMIVCICVGSVGIPLEDTLRALGSLLPGAEGAIGRYASIILSVRLPRVLCVALIGAGLALCGAAMQGLLRNPLADGSTLGVSSGASLGAALAIVLGFSLPGFPLGGTAIMAMVFALGSLLVLLSLAWSLDRSLATNTIILMGVIFSMFVSSLLSLLITFSGEKLKAITFWTMGSLSGSSYAQAALLLGALVVFGGVLMGQTRALNAFALGEDQALHLGVSVRRVKLLVMVSVSCLIGVCVSIGGGIGFVGLAVPHILRMIVGANHARLMPASLFGGAVFLLLCDLLARTAFSPLELPIGVVTSIIGAFVFVGVFFHQRRAGDGA